MAMPKKPNTYRFKPGVESPFDNAIEIPTGEVLLVNIHGASCLCNSWEEVRERFDLQRGELIMQASNPDRPQDAQEFEPEIIKRYRETTEQNWPKTKPAAVAPPVSAPAPATAASSSSTSDEHETVRTEHEGEGEPRRRHR